MNNEKTSVQIPCQINGRLAHRIIYSVQPIKSSIFVFHNGRNVNAKSLLGILSLQLKEKDIIDITCYHDNEYQVKEDIEEVENIFKNINQEDS